MKNRDLAIDQTLSAARYPDMVLRHAAMIEDYVDLDDDRFAPFDDDVRFAPLDEAPAVKAWNPLTLLAAEAASRFAPLGAWVKEGACVGADPTLWDAAPTTDELHEMPEADRPSSRESAARQRQAASVCAACPVRAECLADAQDNEATVGVIRGGVLFSALLGRPRAEHDLIGLAAAGHLNASPAGRGRTAALPAA